MKREDLNKNVKEKLLLEGNTGVGKTYDALRIVKIYLIAGKKVVYIDPEAGTDRDIIKLFDDLTDEELSRFELINATNIEAYLMGMYGLREEIQIGTNQTVIKTKYIDCDLKVCDGLITEIELYKTKLSRNFIEQGYYEIGGKQFTIKNPDTFVLPYNFFGKLYTQIKEALVVMLDHKYDILCTTHMFKNTDAQKDLAQSIYQKFDSVIRLNKTIDPSGFPDWSGNIIKNRGRESPDKSSILTSIDPLIIYYIKKFDMNIEEVIKRVGIVMEE